MANAPPSSSIPQAPGTLICSSCTSSLSAFSSLFGDAMMASWSWPSLPSIAALTGLRNVFAQPGAVANYHDNVVVTDQCI